MGFVPYTVQTRAQVAQGTGFAASLKKVKASPAVLVLTLRPAVVKLFGWMDNNRIAVLLGEGEQRGLIRLSHSADGSAVLVRKEAGRGTRAEYFSINLGHIPAFPDRSEEKRWVKFEDVGDGWELNTRLVPIQTVRAQGYRMEQTAIARVQRLLAEHRDAAPIGQVA